MGKGDKKSKRGKIIQGSYGVSRPKKSGKPAGIKAAAKQVPDEPVEVAPVEKTPKKPASKKTKSKKESESKAETQE